MRIRDDVMYAHPVLTKNGDDFMSGDLNFDCTCRIEASEVKFDVDLTVVQPELESLIRSGKAKLAVDVECQDTYFCRTTEVGSGGSSLTFRHAEFFGDTDVRAIVFAAETIGGFCSADFHADYGPETFNLKKGDLLGFSNLVRFHFPRQRLSVANIFQLVPAGQEDYEPDKFEISLDDDNRIQIIAGKNIHAKISANRNSRPGKCFNLASVYACALLDVLNGICGEEGSDEYQGKAWYAVLDQTLADKGFEIRDEELDCLAAMQLIFENPYIAASEEFEGDS